MYRPKLFVCRRNQSYFPLFSLFRTSPEPQSSFRRRSCPVVYSWLLNCYHCLQLENLTADVHSIWKLLFSEIYLQCVIIQSFICRWFVYVPSPMLRRAVLGYRGVRHKTGLTGIFNVMHNGFFTEILHSSLSYRRSFHYSVNSPVTLRFHYIIYVSWYNSTV